MDAVTLILPHQLFANNPALNQARPVYLLELDYFFTKYTFHKHKLILHRASMESYYHSLIDQGYTVTYFKYGQIATLAKLINLLIKKKTLQIHYAELIENQLNEDLKKAAANYNFELIEYESPYFMSDRALLRKFFKPQKKQYLMAAFYRQQRISLDILLAKDGKPIGGSWSFDTLNRQSLPHTITVPPIHTVRTNSYVEAAKVWVDSEFGANPGSSETFWYPTTLAQAESWLSSFLKERLKLFGPYQDAIDLNDSVLFHSVLTPLINIGLLTPKEVVDGALLYAKKHSVPINSLEGFIRQVIGWREFMYGMYLYHGKKQQNSNCFRNTRSIPNSFWTGTTGIDPIDTTIQHVINTSYAHHIERLMILGNFMLLCQFDPKQVYDWFMELFIDAYDWVMVPNVYGMSQYADGGLLATKPYISGSNYVLKMSNYPKGNWCAVWDSLFWYCIDTHFKTFSQNPRCAFMVSTWQRMNAKKRQEHIACAQRFLNSL